MSIIKTVDCAALCLAGWYGRLPSGFRAVVTVIAVVGTVSVIGWAFGLTGALIVVGAGSGVAAAVSAWAASDARREVEAAKLQAHLGAELFAVGGGTFRLLIYNQGPGWAEHTQVRLSDAERERQSTGDAGPVAEFGSNGERTERLPVGLLRSRDSTLIRGRWIGSTGSWVRLDMDWHHVDGSKAGRTLVIDAREAPKTAR